MTYIAIFLVLLQLIFGKDSEENYDEIDDSYDW